MTFLPRLSLGTLVLVLAGPAFAQTPGGKDDPFALHLSLDRSVGRAVARLHLAEAQLILTAPRTSEAPPPPMAPPLAVPLKSLQLQVSNQPGYLLGVPLNDPVRVTFAAAAIGTAIYFLLNDDNAKAYRNLQDTALPEPEQRPPPR